MSDETYEGWKNHETWAFNLHWQNDQGLYEMTREFASQWLGSNNAEGQPSELVNFRLGEAVVEYWRDFLDTYTEEFGTAMPDGLQMFQKEVGSWWRVDEAETGAAVMESLS
jgi:hypothetical protein